MSDNNPVKDEVQNFDKRCLKKTNTAEKNTLPTKEAWDVMACERRRLESKHFLYGWNRRMVVPDGGSVIQPADNGDADGTMSSSEPEFGPNLTTVELEEVRKLQELVRRLEVQNQALRNRGSKLVLGGNSNLTTGSNINSLHEVMDTSPRAEDAGNLVLSPPVGSSSSEDMSPLPYACRPEDEGQQDGFLSLPCASGSKQTLARFVTSLSPDFCDSETLGAGHAGMDQSALDEVDVLDLETCAQAEDEDSWWVY
ncbi:SLAIN motif-containing protein-like [Anabarilius grahami]|uniref:SLAIN motif-containing protein-like n=1 Tax=Anabarilius grahami TaxID=495550 RepID=A0A3N0XES9_ANAGA|nr:SLAIN motif-containing protein-like [Anabarilius grahami]